MGKVVTSAGLQDFIATGTATETIKTEPKKAPAKEAPPLEVKDDKPINDVGAKKDAPAEIVADDIDDTQVKKEWSKEVLDEIARKNAAINKKHREMREAREAAEEAETFARNQYDRAMRAEARAAEQDRELTELKGKAAPAVKKPELEKPDPQKFYDDKGQFKAFEYAEALAEFSAKKAVADDREAQAEEKRKSDAAAAEAQARARVAETIKKYPDFNEVTHAADVRIHNAVIQYLSASEHIGEVSYYLAKNPDYVERLNKLNPLKAIAEIGKLELTFEKPNGAATDKTDTDTPTVKTSGAPKPIQPLSSATTVNTNTDPAKMTYKELRAYERSRLKRH